MFNPIKNLMSDLKTQAENVYAQSQGDTENTAHAPGSEQEEAYAVATVAAMIPVLTNAISSVAGSAHGVFEQLRAPFNEDKEEPVTVESEVVE